MAAPPDILVLMGLRGSGKSVLGRALAARLDRPFVDLDDRVCARFGGAPVRAIFAQYGEPAWREAETAALAEALAPAPAGDASRCVLALGGGTPTAPGARPLLEAARAGGRAACVFLDADPGLLAARRRGADDRPPLAEGESIAAEIARTRAERTPIFRALADAVVRMRDEPVDDAVDRILAALAAR